MTQLDRRVSLAKLSFDCSNRPSLQLPRLYRFLRKRSTLRCAFFPSALDPGLMLTPSVLLLLSAMETRVLLHLYVNLVCRHKTGSSSSVYTKRVRQHEYVFFSCCTCGYICIFLEGKMTHSWYLCTSGPQVEVKRSRKFLKRRY